MEVVYRGKWIEMINDDGWEYHNYVRGSSSVIIPSMTIDGKYIFVEQYRKPLQSACIEWAAGIVGDENENESVLDAAKRELLEETGFVSTMNTQFIDMPMAASPGASSAKVYFVLCPLCKKVADGGGIDNEDIIIHIIEKNEVVEWLEEQAYEGKCVDSKVYTGIQLLEFYS